MRTLRSVILVGVLCFSIGQSTSGQQLQLPDAVSVKTVNYAQLCDLVEKNKGKVVLLDFWATTCIPCKKSFFQNAEMQKAYGDKGLVVISVSTFEINKLKEGPERTAKEKAILDYLRGQNATFTNVILDEPDDVVEKKLHMDMIPCIYVFTPEGKWTQFIGTKLPMDANHRHPEVESYVKHLVDELAKKK